jgi:hypothetical protein
MKLHRNARLSVKGRELLVDRVENVAGDKLTGLGDPHADATFLRPTATARPTVAGRDRATTIAS